MTENSNFGGLWAVDLWIGPWCSVCSRSRGIEYCGRFTPKNVMVRFSVVNRCLHEEIDSGDMLEKPLADPASGDKGSLETGK